MKPLYPEPNACFECGAPLEQGVIPETDSDLIVQLGRVCPECHQDDAA